MTEELLAMARPLFGGRDAGRGLLIFFGQNYPHPDRKAGEITKVRHLSVRGVPELRLDGLKLCQDGRAVGIIGRDPVGGFEVWSVVGVLLGFITVYNFLLPSRFEHGFFRACLVALKSFQHIGDGLHFLR